MVYGTRALVADPFSSVGNEIGPDSCLTGWELGRAGQIKALSSLSCFSGHS